MNLKDAYLKYGKGIENMVIKGQGLDGAVISSVVKDRKKSRTIIYYTKPDELETENKDIKKRQEILDSQFNFYEVNYD